MNNTFAIDKCYSVEFYQKLLYKIPEVASEASLVLNRPGRYAQSAVSLFESLASKPSDIVAVNQWPGTELGATNATMVRFSLQAHSLKILHSVEKIFEWCGPRFPDDLAFYRADGGLFMGTTSHEQYLWFESSREELEQFGWEGSIRAL